MKKNIEKKQLSLVSFTPKKAELELIVKEAKDLTISGINDRKGYDLVHSKRMELKKTRIQISKTGKELRTEAIAFQRAVIEKEKELISMIAPVETDLETKEKTIDEEKERVKRKALLPERISQLKKIDVSVPEDFLLGMNDKDFSEYLSTEKEKYLEEKERKLIEEQEKIEAEKRKAEEAKRLEAAKKEAEKKAREEAIREAELAKLRSEEEKQSAIDAERRKAEAAKIKAEEDKKKAVEEAKAAKVKAEEDKKKAVEEEKRKAAEAIEAERKRAEDEKARIIAEQKEKEEARIAEEEEKKQRAIAAANKIKNQKKYKDFLAKNGYTEQTKENFYIHKEGNKITLYKKINTITI